MHTLTSKIYKNVKKNVIDSKADVIFVSGLPGSGKTVLAREYGEIFNYEYVNCHNRSTLDFPDKKLADIYIFDDISRMVWNSFIQQVNYLVLTGSTVIILSQRPLTDKTRKFFTNESYVFEEYFL